MTAGLKERSIRALVWSAGDGLGQVALSFVTFLVMARMLEPRDFGLVALAGAVVFFLNLASSQGFPDALVQRRALEADHLDAAFWCSLALSGILMAACLLGASAVAGWFHEAAMAPVLRWLSLSLPLTALGGVSSALLRRDLRFRPMAMSSLAGRTAGALVGLGMALLGHGVWSLVAQQLIGSLLAGLGAIGIARWRPRLRVSPAHLRELWGFGLHVSISQIATALSEHAVNFLVGVIFGSVVLGHLAIAWRMVEIVRSLIGSAVYNVGFSAFARLQSDLPALRQAWLQSTRIACLFGFPLSAALVVLGPQIVSVLFGAKWQGSVPLLQILALGGLPAFHCMFMSALYRAVGRAGWTLYLALIPLAVATLGVLAVAPWGIAAVTWLWVARLYLLVPVHAMLIGVLLRVPADRVLQPAVPALVASGAMAAVLAGLRMVLDGAVGDLALLAIAAPVGAIVYAASARVLFPRLVRDALGVARVMAARRT